MKWEYLKTREDLNKLDVESRSAPVVIFKHSTRCSISAASLNRLERNWDDQKTGNLKAYFLDLISYREISQEISSRYGIEHESPQLLLIKDARCTYTTSHFGINFEELIHRRNSLIDAD